MKLWQQNKKINTTVNTTDDVYSEPISISQICTVEKPQQNIVSTPKKEDFLLEDIFNSETINIDTMSEELAPYITAAKQISKANEGTSPKILECCADGMSKISLYKAKAITNYNLTKAKRKEVESRVIINDFVNWCASTGNKSTDKMREIFCNQHKDVLLAKKNEAEAEGLLNFLESCYQLFVMSLSAVKAVTYGYKASDSTSGQYKTDNF